MGAQMVDHTFKCYYIIGQSNAISYLASRKIILLFLNQK